MDPRKTQQVCDDLRKLESLSHLLLEVLQSWRRVTGGDPPMVQYGVFPEPILDEELCYFTLPRKSVTAAIAKLNELSERVQKGLTALERDGLA